MIIVITYYNFGQRYTEQFTEAQAKKELEIWGFENVESLTFDQTAKFLQEIYTP